MATESDHPSRGLAVAGSWWLLTMVVLGVYLVSPVRDATDADPAFAPLSAHSLVHHGDLTLDRFGARRLIGHPVVVSDGSLDAGFVVSGVGSTGWEQLSAAVADPDVDVVDYFPWTGAVLAVPAVLVADGWAALTGTADSGELLAGGGFAWLHAASASLVVLGAVLAVRATAIAALTGPMGRRRVLSNATALVVALGTSAYSTASRALWQHTPSLLLLTLALWCAVRIDRNVTGPGPVDPTGSDPEPTPEPRDPVRLQGWTVGLAAASAAAAVARPTNLAFAVLIVAWVLYRNRHRPLATAASALLGGSAVVCAFVGLSLLLVGRVVPQYYSAGRLQLGGWFAEAVAANWVSPSRGLLWASPIVVMSVAGTVVALRAAGRGEPVVPGRGLVVALWASVVAVTVSVSAFPQWWAGHAFGPRFMTEAVPALVVLALPAVDRLAGGAAADRDARHPGRRTAALVAVCALALWSVAFHAVGSVAGASGCWNAYPIDVDSDPARVWSLPDAQVLEPVHRVLDPQRRAAQDAVCVGR